jgi:hypothetical protein
MNIYQLSMKSGLSLVKLRKLEKLGALRLDGETGLVDGLIFHMRGNKTLTVAQLLALIERPDLLDELDAARPRYASRAREQIAAVSLVDAHKAPREVTAAIVGASRGDDDESLVIAEWLKGILPPDPVSHAWVAVRLLAPLNAFQREQIAPLISPALLNMRKLPEFAGYWHSGKIGSRSVIQYYRRMSRMGETLDL